MAQEKEAPMHHQRTGGHFDPSHQADDTPVTAVRYAEAGWTTHEVEAAMVEPGFAPGEAAEMIDAAWAVVL
jgi:hypothetical protein